MKCPFILDAIGKIQVGFWWLIIESRFTLVEHLSQLYTVFDVDIHLSPPIPINYVL